MIVLAIDGALGGFSTAISRHDRIVASSSETGAVALERGRPIRVVNWIHLLAEAMGLPHTDEYKLWRNAEEPRAAIGADRIAAAGDVAFERLVEPELRRASTV